MFARHITIIRRDVLVNSQTLEEGVADVQAEFLFADIVSKVRDHRLSSCLHEARNVLAEVFSDTFLAAVTNGSRNTCSSV